MPLLVSIFFGFAPMFLFAGFINWLDRYEKEPKMLLGAAFTWGVIIAGGGAYIINTVLGLGVYIVTGSEGATDFATASIIAPIVEESLKGLAVLVVFFLFYREFDSVLDGIIYGGTTALGFAAIENVLYIYEKGYLEGGWGGLWMLVFVRVILVGWQHPFYTAFTGIGLALARLNRNVLVKIMAVLGGFAVAVITHSFHNTFGGLIGGLEGLALGTFVDWIGWFFMLLFIVWMVLHERNILKRRLQDEVSSGLISPAQYRTALSFAQTGARLNAMASGSYFATSRFYQVCGELAHKKEQFAKLGDERGNKAIIEKLRGELAQLAPQAKV
ncbi:MAG: PrsW family intramembrane metalloprotease, partial [Chloroflexota bacterium]